MNDSLIKTHEPQPIFFETSRNSAVERNLRNPFTVLALSLACKRLGGRISRLYLRLNLGLCDPFNVAFRFKRRSVVSIACRPPVGRVDCTRPGSKKDEGYMRSHKLASVSHEYEANLIAAALTEHGISNHVVGGVMADFRAECPGVVDVMIAGSDLEEATRILEQVNQSADSIDWDNVDVGEPDPTNAPDSGFSLMPRWGTIAVCGAMVVAYVMVLVAQNIVMAN